MASQSPNLNKDRGFSRVAKSNHPWMDPVLWKIQSVSVQQNTSVFGCEAAELGKDLAMQIAAMNPVAVDPESVPAETVARERAIIIDTMKEDPKMAGKPEEMIVKIAEGKIAAFFKEQTLLAQSFVKDGSKTVGDHVKSVGADIKVTEFKRVALG